MCTRIEYATLFFIPIIMRSLGFKMGVFYSVLSKQGVGEGNAEMEQFTCKIKTCFFFK